MRGKVGCPTRIVTRIPHGREIAKLSCVKLSREAKFRLDVMDFYFRKSARFSANKKPNATLTCRHFGIHRSYFYRWLAKYDKHRLSSLENSKRTPKRKRSVSYSWALVSEIREIRKENPTYSAKKIRPILMRTREPDSVPSVATLGRLICRENMFYRADTARRKKRSKQAVSAHARKRKPYDLKADAARRIVEFDMKHIYLLGQKHYAFCAIDPFTKEAAIHIGGSPSSFNAKTALEKTVARFGKDIQIVNDNGSENKGKAEEYLSLQGVTQYFARPHRPKDKPFVERFIGTLQKECLDYHYEPMNVSELAETVDAWIDKYHHYRPHESLEFKTPAEFCDTLGLSIPIQGEVSYM